MIVTGWCEYDTPEYYSYSENIPDDKNDEARACIIEELKNRGIKFDGFYHQNGEFGIPILDDKFVFIASFRFWGKMVAESEGKFDEYDYMDWYDVDPQKVEFVLPKPEWYSDEES